jgi:tRNA A-37 threonylcarbamoyl transferase component Bud32
MPNYKPSTQSVNYIRSGWYRVWSVDNMEVEPIIKRMLPQPEEVLSKATVLSSYGSSGNAYHVKIPGHDYFIKRYDCSGFGYSLKNAFRRSRAKRVWSLSHHLLNLGIPIARPLILIEERKYRLLGRAYLVKEFFSDYECLRNLWGTVCREEQDLLLRHTATALANLHKRGYIHGDTNWKNIMFDRRRTIPEIKFVDLDGSRKPIYLSYARAERDLWHFVRDLQRDYNQGADRVDLFLSTWREAMKK